MLNACRGLAASLTMTLASLAAVLIPTSVLAQSGTHSAPNTAVTPQTPAASSPPVPSAQGFYPDRAERAGAGGRAMIDCAADAEGVLTDCKLVSETPEGLGFGMAALKTAAAGLVHERPAVGQSRVVTSVTFTAETVRLPPRRTTAVLRLVGEKPTPATRVKPGGVIVAFPFAYNRTAVLTEDSEPGKSKPLLRAGAPGYYAGAVPGAIQDLDIWCFQYAAPPLGYVCATPFVKPNKQAGIANVKNTYVFNAVTFTRLHLDAFVFEEKPVEIPGDLRMEYRFKRWTKTEALVEQWAGGRRADVWIVNRRPDGSARLSTLAGTYRLIPAAGAPDEAEISEP